jgi:hypothetical protein
MSDIKFFIPKGQTIPIVLELKVDDVSVTYERIEGGFEFWVWVGDRGKAVEIVEEIVAKIKSEHDDPKHFVTWRTTSIDVLEVSERYGYVRIWWKFYIRDAG